MENKKELIVEALEGKRQRRVWELIKQATAKDIPKEVEKKYFEDYGKYIDDEKNRYIIVEYYNLINCFYYRLYNQADYNNVGFEGMFEDYFSDCEGWEEVLLIDMEEMKAYRISKEILYPTYEIKQEIDRL